MNKRFENNLDFNLNSVEDLKTQHTIFTFREKSVHKKLNFFLILPVNLLF